MNTLDRVDFPSSAARKIRSATLSFRLVLLLSVLFVAESHFSASSPVVTRTTGEFGDARPGQSADDSGEFLLSAALPVEFAAGNHSARRILIPNSIEQPQLQRLSSVELRAIERSRRGSGNPHAVPASGAPTLYSLHRSLRL